MDYSAAFSREVAAFEAVVRQVVALPAAPIVPSCPGWSVSDLVAHLGWLHRWVAAIVRERMTAPPAVGEVGFLSLPSDVSGWPAPDQAPNRGPLPEGLVDWFSAGAAELADLFRRLDPASPAWSWSAEQTVGFWQRTQTIEAAIHRWDAEGAVGSQRPIDQALAVDAIHHTFEVMAPSRRAAPDVVAPEGTGERYRFRATDTPHTWTVTFEGPDLHVQAATTACDVELAGTASDLVLFLWHRLPADNLTVTGDSALVDRYFALVPPN